MNHCNYLSTQYCENSTKSSLSATHLWGNVVIQLVFGIFLEIVHNWKRVATIYLVSVFGGSLFISVLDNAYVVGASGGVYGLLFSHFATIVLNWHEMENKYGEIIYICIYFGINLARSSQKDSHVRFQSAKAD